jgi:hypothetical protein
MARPIAGVMALGIGGVVAMGCALERPQAAPLAGVDLAVTTADGVLREDRCPTALPGARVEVEPTLTGHALVFEIADPAAVPALRERVLLFASSIDEPAAVEPFTQRAPGAVDDGMRRPRVGFPERVDLDQGSARAQTPHRLSEELVPSPPRTQPAVLSPLPPATVEVQSTPEGARIVFEPRMLALTRELGRQLEARAEIMRAGTCPEAVVSMRTGAGL